MDLSMVLNPVEDNLQQTTWELPKSIEISRPHIHQGKCYEALLPFETLPQRTDPAPDFQPQYLPLSGDVNRASFGCGGFPDSTLQPRSRQNCHGSHSYSVAPMQHTWISSHHSVPDEPYRRPSTISDISSISEDSSFSSTCSSQTHNNNKYTVEMIDWIRYHKVDRDLPWEAEVFPRFFEQFPERYHPKATVQTLTSRYYRDNTVPELDANGNWQINKKGQLRLQSANVRGRSTVEGKDIPRTLVDKWPARLLTYSNWKSPVLGKDRERAKEILAGNDPSDLKGKKAEWRRILNSCEHLIYSEKLVDIKLCLQEKL